MRINLKKSETLTAVLGSAITTSNPTYAVNYVTGIGPAVSAESTDVGSLNGTTAATLVTGSSKVVTVRGFTIYNKDTVAATVTVKKVVAAGTGYELFSVTLQTTETLVVDEMGGVTVLDASGQVKTSQVASTALPLIDKRTISTLTDTATVTIAQLLTKVLQGTPTGAATYTLPTAALLVAGMSNCRVGDSFNFHVDNRSGGANTITMDVGTNGTKKGTMTVAQNVNRMFSVVVTSIASGSEAYTLYGMG